MRILVVAIVVGLLMMNAPAEAQAPGKRIKRAPFPEPSKELVGMLAGGKFYVLGGLGPGWIPQGLVYGSATKETNAVTSSEASSLRMME